MTLFDSYYYDGWSAVIWVIHRGGKSGGSELVKVKVFFCMKAATDIILSLKEDISFVES